MDYLSRKQLSKTGSDDHKNRGLDKHSTFNSLCESMFNKLNPDEQADICEKFLKSEVISVLKDTDLIECINAFFNNNLNISEASRNAFLHRNTLLYRIEKIYKQTGLNIRNFEDAITFKILQVVYQKMADRLGNGDEN